MKYKDYGSEYPFIPWRKKYRRSINTKIMSTATIIVLMSVIVITIAKLPGAIDKEVRRQVAVVEKSIGVQK